MSTNLTDSPDTVAPPADPVVAGIGNACSDDSRDWVRGMIERIADKWTILVIEALAHGTLRFTALQAAVPGISHRMLTLTLKNLRRNGLVSRTAYAEVPPRVDYALTPLGRTLIEPVNILIAWANTHRSDIDTHRSHFDT
jgi:DNA-binding HxlR family transcriptional regulator